MGGCRLRRDAAVLLDSDLAPVLSAAMLSAPPRKAPADRPPEPPRVATPPPSFPSGAVTKSPRSSSNSEAGFHESSGSAMISFAVGPAFLPVGAALESFLMDVRSIPPAPGTGTPAGLAILSGMVASAVRRRVLTTKKGLRP